MNGADGALDAVRSMAHLQRASTATRWQLTEAGRLNPDLDAVISDAQAAGRLTVNFHPDRVARSGLTVLEGLAATGQYVSQWRTGISSGGRFAGRGGERQRWEHELFGGAYTDADPQKIEFPIYGTWDLLGDPHGGAPRFGSCFLVLGDTVRARTTICLGDSHVGPTDIGTLDGSGNVIAGLAEQADAGHVLGEPAGPGDLLDLLGSRHTSVFARRDLDNYIETQVHGGIDLARDVKSIVADPSFKGMPIGRSLDGIASEYGITIDWHQGSELAVNDVPSDFRGPSMPALARRIAGSNETIDAKSIGVAARSVPWSEATIRGDAPESDIQQLKRLWHTLVAFGHDARTA